MLTYNIFIFFVTFFLYFDYKINADNDLYVERKRVSFFMFLTLSLIVFFAGFRLEIGYDYPKYLAGYMFDSELKHWEPLFNFVTKTIREVNFGLESQALFLFFSFITILVLYLAIRKLTPHVRTSLLLYLLVPALFLNSFSVVRQALAMVILLYGLYYLTVEVDRRKYIFFGLLAFLFHYSSIFVILAYLVLGNLFNKTYSWIVYVFGIMLSFALYFSHIGKGILLMLPGHFSTYAHSEISVSILKLVVVNAFFIFFVLQKDTFIETRLQRYLLNSMFLATLLFNIFADFTYVTRISQYFLVSEIILVPMYIYSFKEKFKQQLFLILFLTYYLFNFNYALYRDEYYTGSRPHFLVPYKNYLFEEKKSFRNTNLEAWYNYIIENSSSEEEKK